MFSLPFKVAEKFGGLLLASPYIIPWPHLGIYKGLPSWGLPLFQQPLGAISTCGLAVAIPPGREKLSLWLISGISAAFYSLPCHHLSCR